ncbi:MAG: DUF3833 family protein [Hyphomicrobiaceae bacterium]
MAHDALPIATMERFEITRFLRGRTLAWGIVEDRFGTLRRRFNVEMNGYWEGGSFLLDEQFVYDTGERERRQWRITPLDHGRFSATCDDCIGHAEGECLEDAIRMSYCFRMQVGERTITVRIADRLYRMGDDLAINRATIRKWGVKLGELSIFFRRERGEVADRTRAGTI